MQNRILVSMMAFTAIAPAVAQESPSGASIPLAMVRTASLHGDFAGLPAQDDPAFGYSVALDGDWLAVGAPDTIRDAGEYGVARHGAVFLFRHAGGWQPVQRIGTNLSGEQHCGHSIALAGSYLAVGCPGGGVSTDPDGEHGRFYLYRLHESGEWQLIAATGIYHAGARCGTSIALSSVHSYARNNGRNFKEDPAGLSDTAVYRRPVQQLGAILKAGSAENIEPGDFLSTDPAQRPGAPKTRPIQYDAQRRLDPNRSTLCGVPWNAFWYSVPRPS